MIGNGSSGVQIIPKLASLPGTQVISFQRSPNYVYSRLAPASLLGRDDVSQNPAYTEEDKRRFREDKEFHRQYRRKIIHGSNSMFKMVSIYRLCRLLLPVQNRRLKHATTVCEEFGREPKGVGSSASPNGGEAKS